MLAAVVIGIIVICISGVDSGPPDLSGPKIPRAELHEIYPEHGPVGHQIKITLSGKYFTEEYGVGVLRCKFKYSSGRSEPLEEVTLARRTTGGCIVTADPKHYETTNNILQLSYIAWGQNHAWTYYRPRVLRYLHLYLCPP